MHTGCSRKALRSTQVGLLALLAAATAAPATAQLQGGDRGGPEPRNGGALVNDPNAGRVYLVGGTYENTKRAGTWSWDGCHWSSFDRMYHTANVDAAAFNEKSSKIVVLEGSTASPAGVRVREWDGRAWQSFPPGGLGPTYSETRQQRVTFDSSRGEVVMLDAFKRELWAWSGDAQVLWRQVDFAPAMINPYVAFDSHRNVLVVADPDFSQPPFDRVRTWERSSSGWVDRGITLGMAANSYAAMVYDPIRRRTVFHGGFTSSGTSGRTWEWDGGKWVMRADDQNVSRAQHLLTFDSGRGQVMMHGGNTDNYWVGADTWHWDGSKWSRCSPEDTPQWRERAAMVYDAGRGRIVMFGGLTPAPPRDEFHEWNGVHWETLRPGAVPPLRQDHALAYDPIRWCTVMYGGAPAIDRRVWEWDGLRWKAIATAVAPPAVTGHSMTFDPNLGVVVLYGGRDATGALLNETWSWDGTTWTNIRPASPPAMEGHGMATDPIRKCVVLAGGRTANGPATDTWEWDGSHWTRTTTCPSGPDNTLLAFHKARGRIVLYDSASFYEYGSNGWTLLTSSQPRISRACMAYDERMEELVLFGGQQPTLPGGRNMGTWVWGDSSARTAAFGLASCSGSLGKVTLAQYGLPRIGNPAFAVDLVSASPNSAGLILLGLSKLDQDIGSGCRLYVDPNGIFVPVPVRTSAVGLASVRVPVPFAPSLSGLDAFAQGVVADGGPWNGLSLSHGLAVTFGH